VKPLVAVVGPTGSGKSDLAIAVAREFQGEIVNCDSIQLYRYLDAGSAKVPAEQRRGIPHHLIDILDPNEIFTAGEYARRARAVLAGISSRNHLAIVAGGTGFYLRALLEGLFRGPTRDDSLRARLARREALRPGSLHRLLHRFDADAAARIHARDLPKVTRALEVCLLTRRPVTELFREGRQPLAGYRISKIGLFPDRDALSARLEKRASRMFESGLVEEVRGILERGFSPQSKALESLGYSQALQVIRGELTVKEAIFYTQRDTRRYAKRQLTWFRRERDLHVFRGFGDDGEIQRAVIAEVGQFLR
jgi:tRNA dimethylallyltransferase